ncbi:Cache 3/Cache 2 fusion domain-containing protein, partial [Bradyrhizobium sp.]|uniref:Cache 3/Cache 2 fusion domain-containing protein n=1 Tax=Bradyrhizobium sp. TaxID=376 RepID=UPI00391A9790
MSLKLKLGTKALIGAVVVIALNTALVVGAAYWSLSSDFADRAKRDIEGNLRTFALTFAETFKDAKVSMQNGAVTRIEVPTISDIKDHAIVDRATSYVGGSATLFVVDDNGQFVRRSTNVKKENGDRAVGTQLAADHPAQPLLRRGEAYKGPAVLFGKPFMTAYFPVTNPAGKVIGILYVGVPMAELDAMLSQVMQTMMVAAAIAALLVLGLTMLAVRRVTKPLTAVAEALTAIADGREHVDIGSDDRSDEIGEIARSLMFFRSAAARPRRGGRTSGGGRSGRSRACGRRVRFRRGRGRRRSRSG